MLRARYPQQAIAVVTYCWAACNPACSHHTWKQKPANASAQVEHLSPQRIGCEMSPFCRAQRNQPATFFSVEAETSAAVLPLANGLFVFPRHLRHVLISIGNGKQIVPGPSCAEPLCHSACFLRAFSPKALIQVKHFCHHCIPFTRCDAPSLTAYIGGHDVVMSVTKIRTSAQLPTWCNRGRDFAKRVNR